MLYYLFRYLERFGVSGAGLWQYISFRAILTLVLSLLISMWFGQYFIKWMRRHKASEVQRDASIDPYGVEKQGVPSMGGVIIIIATVIPCLLFGRLRNIYMLMMLFTTLWLGALGFADDYTKLKISKDGLRPIYKLVGQAILGLVIGLTLWLSPDAVIRENITMTRDGANKTIIHKSEPVKSNITTIPFVKNNNLSYTEVVGFCGKYRRAVGWILFHICGDGGEQRQQSQRWDGWYVCRQLCHHVCRLRRLGLRKQSHRDGKLPKYYVYPGQRGTGHIPLCFRGRAGRFSVVQRISGTSFHGRHGQFGHRRHYSSCRHHYSQGIAPAAAVFCLSDGECQRAVADKLRQAWQPARGEMARLQASSVARHVPCQAWAVAKRFPSLDKLAQRLLARVKDNYAVLDCHHNPCRAHYCHT